MRKNLKKRKTINRIVSHQFSQHIAKDIDTCNANMFKAIISNLLVEEIHTQKLFSRTKIGFINVWEINKNVFF